MRVAILEQDDQIFEILESSIKTSYSDWKVIRYLSSFALVTGIADELKGDVNLILIHVPPHMYDYVRMAKDLQGYFSHIRVIFYSESNDCAEQIFEATPSYFLHLPIKEACLEDALERVKNDHLLEEGQTITLRFRGEIQKIRFRSISYVESVGRKVRFYTNLGSFETYKTMEELKDILPAQFQQCHRSYLVNTDKIAKVTAEGILLSDMELIPLSRTYFDRIKQICQKN